MCACVVEFGEIKGGGWFALITTCLEEAELFFLEPAGQDLARMVAHRDLCQGQRMVDGGWFPEEGTATHCCFGS